MATREGRSWTEATEAEWAIARTRERVVRGLAEAEITKAAVDDAMKMLGLSRSVVSGLVRRYRQCPQRTCE